MYQSLVFYVVYIIVCPFVFFLAAIVLSVLLRFTTSDYQFGILVIDDDMHAEVNFLFETD